ncbi:MAG: HDOD domain-containing protein [Solirubrobacterales bacterium]|nr:HDOD domain-containing protein [Solirubrobacterales bacterium]MBV9534466.1 HDOD domain-containing protein [Solirubrobacterales bacterium]
MANGLADSSVATNPLPARERRHNESHGRRLTAAFEALEGFPVLAESRSRLLALFSVGEPSAREVVGAVESDVALTIAVLRLANRLPGPHRREVDCVPDAVELLSLRTVHAIAHRAQTFDFFEPNAAWQEMPERFRLHAGATRLACDRLAEKLRYDARDRLAVASLLHDIGKLVLVHAYVGYPRGLHGDAATPEERLARERRELGVDHALVGGVLARRWALPNSIARAIEHHHGQDGGAEATLVRLADMVAHYAAGRTVSPAELLAVARAAGLRTKQLREVIYDSSSPLPVLARRPGASAVSPLSPRELEVLRRLARGMVYKQIASELGLSPSTVRSHLHNVYGKVGARDRAQAVLIATERGWI